MCVKVLPAYMCVYLVCALGAQNVLLNLLPLKLQMAMSCYVSVVVCLAISLALA